MSKLTENFKRLNEVIEEEKNLIIEKLSMGATYKENIELQRYIAIEKRLEAISKKRDEAKKLFYDLMLEGDIDILNGKACDITLKKPYLKREFDLKQLLEDYNKQPDDERLKYIVEHYVSDKTVKGNVSIKDVPDEV